MIHGSGLVISSCFRC